MGSFDVDHRGLRISEPTENRISCLPAGARAGVTGRHTAVLVDGG